MAKFEVGSNYQYAMKQALLSEIYFIAKVVYCRPSLMRIELLNVYI